jgi:hypothetical protein
MNRKALVLAALVLASTASAGEELITFSEVPVGTAIDGVTIASLATFHTQTQVYRSPTVEVEGVPDDGPWGTGAFLIGEFGDFITIDLAVPARRVQVFFTLDDTIHSSVQMHLAALNAQGEIVAFVQGFPEFSGTWSVLLRDSTSGSAMIEDVGPIKTVEVSFAAGVFATMFALDNISLQTPRCNSADFAEPFGELDFFDIARFLHAFSNGEGIADRVAPFGVFDFFDVASYLDEFAAGCP